MKPDIYDLFALTIETEIDLNRKTGKIIFKGYVSGYCQLAIYESNWDGKEINKYRLYKREQLFKYNLAKKVLDEDFLKD